MTLLDAPVVLPAPAAAVIDPERRLALTGVSWATYARLCDEVVRGPTKITYDRGRMEIVVVSNRHEWVKKILSRIVEAYADAVGIVAEGFGGMTLRREDLERGLEPDECYYVAHAAETAGWGGEEHPLDLTVDPPPDLAIEVDISPPDVAKPPIYAALGVPEIWRYDGRAVAYLHRQPDGRYVVADHSLAFPGLPLAWVNECLAIGLTQSQSAAAAEVRRRVGGRPQP
jgi:Uma2 family endonuclease